MTLQPVASAIAGTGGEILLGFGSEYTAPDGSGCVHRGVDVAVASGEEFVSPVDGTVTFAGRVPGPHGGSVMAVTVSSSHGKVSMMPFERLSVAKGESIEAGRVVGHVDALGDPSSAEPHIHVSLRTGDLYVDPSSLLVAPPAMAEPQPDPVQVPVVTPERLNSQAPAPGAGQPAVTGAVTPATTVPVVPLATGVSVAPAPAQAPEASTAGAISRPGPAISLNPASIAAKSAVDSGVQVVSATTQTPRQAAGSEGLPSPLGIALESVYGLAQQAVRFGSQHLLLAALVFSGTFAAITVLLSRRAVARRVTSETPVSHRWGTLLQQLRTGDRLRGFTPAPGTLPSQSRGRSAQRR